MTRASDRAPESTLSPNPSPTDDDTPSAVGILSSPHVAGRLGPYAIEETEFVSIGAELGIVFLLLFLWLEFDFERFLASRDRFGRLLLLDRPG